MKWLISLFVVLVMCSKAVAAHPESGDCYCFWWGAGCCYSMNAAWVAMQGAGQQMAACGEADDRLSEDSNPTGIKLAHLQDNHVPAINQATVADFVSTYNTAEGLKDDGDGFKNQADSSFWCDGESRWANGVDEVADEDYVAAKAEFDAAEDDYDDANSDYLSAILKYNSAHTDHMHQLRIDVDNYHDNLHRGG